MEKKSIHFILWAFLLVCCSEVYSQVSSIYFYRPKSMFMANTSVRISVNDTAAFNLENGDYYEIKTTAPSISIITSMDNSGLKSLTIEKGKNYYIKVEMKGPKSVSLIQDTEFAGKPAVERMKLDREAASSSAANSSLNVVNVTTVVPLPDSTSGKATVYLFRPFNVLGVNFTAKVSDGSTIYEMKNKSSYVIVTDKEELNLKTVNDGQSVSNTSLKLKLQKGKIYYVAVLRNGGALVLTDAKREYAKQEMKLQ